MDNLPDKFKYNPLVIDDGGWVPMRTNKVRKNPQMSENFKKNCLGCKYAPVLLFIILDILISYFGASHQMSWGLLQLLLGSFYIKSSAYQEAKQPESEEKQMKVSSIILCLMAGITLRDIGLFYWLM